MSEIEAERAWWVACELLADNREITYGPFASESTARTFASSHNGALHFGAENDWTIRRLYSAADPTVGCDHRISHQLALL